MIKGLHHVTATTWDAQQDLDFAAGALGMRLVKKTINFDNPRVYHFYYGDETGSAGTLWTTFPYRGWGVPRGTIGAGQVTTTSLSVPAGSAGFWLDRLSGHGVDHGHEEERFGESVIALRDPSGLAFELIESAADGRAPWTTDQVAADSAVRGLHSVTLAIRNPQPSLQLLTSILGWEVVAEEGSRTRLAAGNQAPGHYIDVVHDTDSPPGRNGTGTVHHVAMAVASDEDQLEMRARLVGAGLMVTDVKDRQYFHSIYFREPGGVLYEIATIPPGMPIDEDVAELGTGLKLPPWEEPHRSTIESGLAQVEHP